jgi:hypothetical protein
MVRANHDPFREKKEKTRGQQLFAIFRSRYKPHCRRGDLAARADDGEPIRYDGDDLDRVVQCAECRRFFDREELERLLSNQHQHKEEGESK